MALKEVGLSLEQISLMIDEELPTEQIRGMLRLRQVEIQQQVQAARKQLAMVEFRLHMIEAETDFPILDVVIKRLEPMRVLSLIVQKQHTMKSVALAIRQAVEQGLIHHTGVTLDIYHGNTIVPLNSPEIHEGQHEILLGVGSSQESVVLPDIGQLTARIEPEIEAAATLMLIGRNRAAEFERVALLQRWAVAHGYRLRSFVRYWLHRGPLHTLNREEFVIEAQLPDEAAG